MLRSGECNYYAMFSYKYGAVGRELAKGENNEAAKMGRSSKSIMDQMQMMKENRMLENMKRNTKPGENNQISNNEKA